MTESEYLSKAALKKDRGWTDTAIKKFLGEPDKLGYNPYSSKMSSHLYLIPRIDKIEKTPDFVAWKEKSEKRRASALKAAQTRRDKTLAKVAARLDEIQLCPEVRGLKGKKLKKYAIMHYEERELDRCWNWDDVPRTVDKDAPLEFIQRIEVNFLRHEGTMYDEELEEYAGSTGVREAVDMVRERVYDLIAKEYPFLKKECERQLQQRRDEQAQIEEYLKAGY